MLSKNQTNVAMGEKQLMKQERSVEDDENNSITRAYKLKHTLKDYQLNSNANV